jgi:predicted nuclease with TOPRIM domain
MVSRREFIKFLTGLGLGASAIELYERLYNIPLLEKSFRAEINYWMNEYNKANEEIKKIESEKKSLSQSLKENQEKVSELTQILSYEDELEK